MKVWIAHVPSDSTFALRLATDLERAGMEVQSRMTARPNGTPFVTIVRGISASDVFVPILSTQSAGSPSFSTELAIALFPDGAGDTEARNMHRIRIVTVCAEAGARVPRLLQRFRPIDLSSELYESGLSSLVQEIRGARGTAGGPAAANGTIVSHARSGP